MNNSYRQVHNGQNVNTGSEEHGEAKLLVPVRMLRKLVGALALAVVALAMVLVAAVVLAG